MSFFCVFQRHFRFLKRRDRAVEVGFVLLNARLKEFLIEFNEDHSCGNLGVKVHVEVFDFTGHLASHIDYRDGI